MFFYVVRNTSTTTQARNHTAVWEKY